MDLKKLSEPLTVEQIDFRIQSINKGGYATILAYKDARVDMQRLDDVCGPLNWKREHTRENKNCIISIWDTEKEQWVGKEDTGVESYTEKEKGLASDSFKRAGFNLGIGRELYDYPVIQIELNQNEFTKKKDNQGKEKAYATWELKLREWVWKSSFTNKKLSFLQAVDNHGKVRFTWKDGVAEPEKKKDDVPNPTAPPLLEQLKGELDKISGLDALLDWYEKNRGRVNNMLQGKDLTDFRAYYTTVKTAFEGQVK